MRKCTSLLLPALLLAAWLPVQAQGQQPARTGESIAGKAAAAKAQTAAERKRTQATATAPAAVAPAAAAAQSTSTAATPSGPDALKTKKSNCHSSGSSDA